MQEINFESQSGMVQLQVLENIVKIEDDCIPISKKNNLHPYQSGLWLKNNQKIYYFDGSISITQLINKILGSKISNILGIPTVQYKLAKMDYKNTYIYGLLSEYERNPKSIYLNLEMFIYGENNLTEKSYQITDLSFLKALEETYPNQPITNQLKGLLVRDLITQHKVRNMSTIQLQIEDTTVSIDKVFNYGDEWKLYGPIGSDSEIDQVTPKDINLRYKIPGLLKLTPKDYSKLKNDKVFQKYFEKVSDIEIPALLEQIQMETKLPINDLDYDYYSLYLETVKSKLKKKHLMR